MKLNHNDIKVISYDKRTSIMEIFNQKGLLIFRKEVEEAFFNATVKKYLDKKDKNVSTN